VIVIWTWKVVVAVAAACGHFEACADKRGNEQFFLERHDGGRLQVEGSRWDSRTVRPW
jgi:hypothetical protein